MELRSALEGKRVLCILDDVWTREAYEPFSNVLDLHSGNSRLLLTTRLKGLYTGASEFELGLLSPDDSVALMLECAGVTLSQPYSPLMYKAVELCGRLALVVSIAGTCMEDVMAEL